MDIGELRKKINGINSSDRYKDSFCRPSIHPDLLELVMTKDINLEEYKIQDYLKQISEIIKPNLLNNEDQITIILEFKGTKLVSNKKLLNMDNEDKVIN